MKNLEGNVHNSMYHQVQKRGYATPVDVLMDIGWLDKKKYEDWRAGRIPYLERVCLANLHKLAEVLKVMRAFAVKNGWKASFTSYKHKGKQLRFSKYGNPNVEEKYATHYVRVGNEKSATKAERKIIKASQEKDISEIVADSEVKISSES